MGTLCSPTILSHGLSSLNYQQTKLSECVYADIHTIHCYILNQQMYENMFYISDYNKKHDCLSRVVMVTDEKPQILNCNIQFYFK